MNTRISKQTIIVTAALTSVLLVLVATAPTGFLILEFCAAPPSLPLRICGPVFVLLFPGFIAAWTVGQLPIWGNQGVPDAVYLMVMIGVNLAWYACITSTYFFKSIRRPFMLVAVATLAVGVLYVAVVMHGVDP